MHSIQITKYRGSGYAAAEFPVDFGPSGIEIGGTELGQIAHEVSTERITSGFKRPDTMLGGGVFRGTSTLVTYLENHACRRVRAGVLSTRRAHAVREL
jgi:circadian clock protein KaiC